MRVIFTTILFLMAISVSAQKKLKYDLIKSTGDTLYRSPEKRIYTQPSRSKAVGELLSSTVYRSKNGFMLALSIQTGRTNIFTVSAGSSVEIRLTNGTVVRLTTNSDNTSRTSLLGYGCTMNVFYHFNNKDRSALKDSPVEFIRIQSSTGNMDYPIKEKAGDTIQEQLSRFDND